MKDDSRPPMVCWYNPVQLAKTGVELVVSTILGQHLDRRLSESVALDADHEAAFYDFSERPEEDFWLDYISDVGDGWNATHTLAYYLSRPELHLRVRDINEPASSPELTKRGRILVLGGDEVYPTASDEEYKKRLVHPYQTAFARSAEGVSPSVFAVPGNHDWYDSLASFTRLFMEKGADGLRRFCGWQTHQNRSYFAVKLPHGWWLLGTDMQLNSALDGPQVDYFRRVVAQMQEDDRIILCHAEPHWVYAKMWESDGNADNHSLRRFEAEILQRRARVYIAGDLHHYRRHEHDFNQTQRITAGGGGAFLHPTHGLDVSRVGQDFVCDLKKSYPDENESRKLCWANFLFPFLNPAFGILTGLLYLAGARAFVPAGAGDAGASFGKDFVQTITTIVAEPAAFFWAILLVGGFWLFTDTHSKPYRFIAGALHGLAHLVATIFLAWWATQLVSSKVSAWPQLLGLGACWLLCALAGWWLFHDPHKVFDRLLPGVIFGLAFAAATLALNVYLLEIAQSNAAGKGISTIPRLLIGGVVVFAGGWFWGSFIMGVYLFISLNDFKRHYNEAFSSFMCPHWKNFVRMRIDPQGTLTIFPVGVRRVATKWRNVNTAKRLEIIPEDGSGSGPELIEPPIIVPKTLGSMTGPQKPQVHRSADFLFNRSVPLKIAEDNQKGTEANGN